MDADIRHLVAMAHKVPGIEARHGKRARELGAKAQKQFVLAILAARPPAVFLKILPREVVPDSRSKMCDFLACVVVQEPVGHHAGDLVRRTDAVISRVGVRDKQAREVHVRPGCVKDRDVGLVLARRVTVKEPRFKRLEIILPEERRVALKNKAAVNRVCRNKDLRRLGAVFHVGTIKVVVHSDHLHGGREEPARPADRIGELLIKDEAISVDLGRMFESRRKERRSGFKSPKIGKVCVPSDLGNFLVRLCGALAQSLVFLHRDAGVPELVSVVEPVVLGNDVILGFPDERVRVLPDLLVRHAVVVQSVRKAVSGAGQPGVQRVALVVVLPALVVGHQLVFDISRKPAVEPARLRAEHDAAL